MYLRSSLCARIGEILKAETSRQNSWSGTISGSWSVMTTVRLKLDWKCLISSVWLQLDGWNSICEFLPVLFSRVVVLTSFSWGESPILKLSHSCPRHFQKMPIDRSTVILSKFCQSSYDRCLDSDQRNPAGQVPRMSPVAILSPILQDEANSLPEPSACSFNSRKWLTCSSWAEKSFTRWTFDNCLKGLASRSRLQVSTQQSRCQTRHLPRNHTSPCEWFAWNTIGALSGNCWSVTKAGEFRYHRGA